MDAKDRFPELAPIPSSTKVGEGRGEGNRNTTEVDQLPTGAKSSLTAGRLGI